MSGHGGYGYNYYENAGTYPDYPPTNRVAEMSSASFDINDSSNSPYRQSEYTQGNYYANNGGAYPHDSITNQPSHYHQSSSQTLTGAVPSLSRRKDEFTSGDSLATLSDSALISIPNSKRDSQFSSPEIQKQLAKITSKKPYKPYFVAIITLLQLVGLILSFVFNFNNTGSYIQTQPQFNILIGPSTEVLIQMGARFTPCMKPSTVLNETEPLVCAEPFRPKAAVSNIITNSNKGVPPAGFNFCTLDDFCGYLGAGTDQWFRFILPIFLHGGVVHFATNMLFQLTSVRQLEKDWGWWRVGPIYMISGITGFIFGGSFAPERAPSVGCSGSLFGIFACLLLDLLQHWKLLRSPWCALFRMLLIFIVSFAIGLLPQIDNFAHVGGFIGGLLAGLLFMPTISFGGKFGKLVKRGVFKLAGAVLLILLLWFLLTGFYNNDASQKCSWCKYIDCLPIGGIFECEVGVTKVVTTKSTNGTTTSFSRSVF